MPKKSIRYIRCYYCMVCQEKFFLTSHKKKICYYCGNKDNIILLSEKEETEREIIETFKKDISIAKKIIQRDYLEGSFKKNEREDLDRLRELKYMEDFFDKNPNPKIEDVLKMINKK